MELKALKISALLICSLLFVVTVFVFSRPAQQPEMVQPVAPEMNWLHFPGEVYSL